MLTKSQIAKLVEITSNLFLLRGKKFAITITYEESEEYIMFDDTLVLKELNNFSGCSKNSKYQRKHVY